MKPTRFSLFLAASVFAIGLSTAGAQTLYWKGGNGTWTAPANWSGTADGSGPGSAPNGEALVFNTTGTNGNETVTLDADSSVASLTFSNTGTTTILGPTVGIRTLTIGTGGITLAAGAGAVTIGSGGNDAGIPIRLSANQTWTNNSSSTLTINNSIAPSTSTPGVRTLTIDGTGTTALTQFIQNTTSGADVNALSLVKNGIGTLNLSGTSETPFSGGLFLNGGTTIVNAANRLGTGAITFNGGTLQVAGSFQTGAAEKPIVINAGGGTISVTSGNTFRHDGTISGDGQLTKTGAGTLYLVNPKTYTGGTAINEGVVEAFLDDRLGTGGLSFNGGTLRLTGDTTVNRATTLNAGGGTIEIAATRTVTHNGVIGGGGALVKTGDGVLALGGVNNYTGGTTIKAGVLSVNAVTRLGSGAVTLDGGSLRFTSTLNSTPYFSNALNILPTGGSVDVTGSNTVRFDGAITGGTLTKTGSGVLYLVGAKTYTGGTQLNGGTVLFFTADRLGSGGLGFNGGRLQTNADNVTISQNAVLNASGGILSAASATHKMTFTGSISGGGSLSVDGNGVVEIGGTNSYTGATTVNQGTMLVKTSINSSTALNVTGGTFQMGASDIISNSAAVTFGNGGVFLTENFSDTLGVLAVTGNATINLTGESMLHFANSSAANWTGALALSGWSGLAAGGDTEGVYFGSTAGGLTVDQLGRVTFVNPEGYDQGIYSAKILASGEVVPFQLIPEVSVSLMAALAGVGLVIRRRR